MFERLKVWIRRFVWFVSIILLVSAGFLLLSARFSIPGGYRLYTVLSGSMMPTIPIGSLVVSKNTTSDIHNNDIITFEEVGSSRLITHRVVEVKEGAFITKGDANAVVDILPVAQKDIRGKYIRHIPKAGTVLEFIKSPRGLVPFVILPAVILVILELQSIVHILVDRKIRKIQGALILLIIFMSSIQATYAAFVSNKVTIVSSRITTAALFEDEENDQDSCGNITVHASNTNTGPGSTNINTIVIRCREGV